MTSTPIEIVQQFLASTSSDEDIERASHELVAPDAKYVSLNFENPDLKRVAPWAGTSCGPEAFIGAFGGVLHHWTNEDFGVDEIFGDGERVAAFGHFTYRSISLGHATTSPFAIFARVQDGKICEWLFMEDTFATARTFRSGGTWTIQTQSGQPPIEV